VDGDGVAEFIAYSDHVFWGDCTHPCREIFLETPDRVETSWPTVYKRLGPLQWQPAESEYPAFYAELAGEFARMAERAEADPACTTYPLEAAETFREWAARADSIARVRAIW